MWSVHKWCNGKKMLAKAKKEQWKKILENYMLKEQYGNHMVEIQYVWVFFSVNDNKMSIWNVFKLYQYIFCYNSPILVCNPKTQARKGLI